MPTLARTPSPIAVSFPCSFPLSFQNLDFFIPDTIMTTKAPPAKMPESRLSNSLDGGSDDEDDEEVEGSADHPTEY